MIRALGIIMLVLLLMAVLGAGGLGLIFGLIGGLIGLVAGLFGAVIGIVVGLLPALVPIIAVGLIVMGILRLCSCRP